MTNDPTVTYSATSVVIDKPIEDVWQFVTVPGNWVKLGLGTYYVHGLYGWDDTKPTARTMIRGEHFFEYMCVPGEFDFVGEWEIHTCEPPELTGGKMGKWGFVSRRYYGKAPPANIEAMYTLEKLSDTSTRWSRNRTNTILPDAKVEVDFLAGTNQHEDEYQRITKSFIETGQANPSPRHKTKPHDRGWLETLPVIRLS